MLRAAIRPSRLISGRSCCRMHREITTLAIETSCDDTSVAVLDIDWDGRQHSLEAARCDVRYHRTITSDSHQYRGIHPLVAGESHQANLATLLTEARRCLTTYGQFRPPTFVSATRGPGMRSSLIVGLTMAKALAVAWDVPLVGVHHMQAHALTPRLCSLISSQHEAGVTPAFPYLTVLASGGHTMLLRSEGLTEHSILADSSDIAIGDCIDKAARAVLPPELLTFPYGRALERFAFPNGSSDYQYSPPASRKDEGTAHATSWGWSMKPPLGESTRKDEKTKQRMFTFSGLLTSVDRLIDYGVTRGNVAILEKRPPESITLAERRTMAQELLRVTFEHLVSRVLHHLEAQEQHDLDTVVVSGGVAANQYLRHILRSTLDIRGFQHIKTRFPPIELCTDNALMIAWAGVEMFTAGYRTKLDVLPIRTWSMESKGSDGGILGANGWMKTDLGMVQI